MTDVVKGTWWLTVIIIFLMGVVGCLVTGYLIAFTYTTVAIKLEFTCVCVCGEGYLVVVEHLPQLMICPRSSWPHSRQ